MKILYLIYDHTLNPWLGGGGAVRAHELNRRLVSMGHSVTVLSGRYPGAVDGSVDGVEYIFRGLSSLGYVMSTFSYAAAASAYVKDNSKNFDLVIEDFAPWNPAFCCWLSSVPVALHVNHREGTGILKRYGPLGLPFYLTDMHYHKMFKNVFVASEGTQKRLARPDAAVVPNGLGKDTIKAGAEAAGEPEQGYVLYMGRLEIANKGLDTLIKAAPMIDAKVIIAGRGRDEARLRNMARGLNVEFAGFVPEEQKASLMAGASVLVLPSRFEGWGIVVLEAAASGRPVVASDIDELSYVADSGIGLTFKTAKADDLAHKVKQLLSDNSARAGMGSRALAFAASHDWDDMAALYAKYIKSLVGVD